VAYRLRQDGKQSDWLGSALDWPWHATVWSGTPHAGDVAYWDPGVNGANVVYGHVAYVAAVYDNNTMLVEEYNTWEHPRGYATRVIPVLTADGGPSRYLQF
jgi:surface antigen